MIIAAGKTNVTADVYFVDDDGGTAPGEPTTGKLFSDIETGGSASYHRQGAARVDFALVTQTAAGAHTDGGFVLIDDTNMPGLYRLDVPDAAFATGVDYVVIQLVMASANNSIMRPLLIDLSVANIVWDEVLTGATHNVTNSSGRRIREQQELGRYALGAIFIDTVNGTAGTTNFENGVDINPVDSIADANTIAASTNLTRFVITAGSSITFTATQSDEDFIGKNWILDLGSQSVSGSHIEGAEVTGTGTGASEIHFEHCEIGTTTITGAHFDDCDIEGTVICSAAATYVFMNCVQSGTTPTIDFGTAVGVNTTIHVHNYHGELTIANMGQAGTDVLHFTSSGGKLTLAASCVGGTVNINGTFDFVNSGSGLTINDDGAILETVGIITNAAAAGDPTSTDTIVQYVKQLVNVLVGSDGVVTFPAAAAPADAVSLAQVIRATYDDTAVIGAAGAGLTESGGTGDQLTAINLPNQTMDIVGDITGNLSGSVGSVTAEVTADVTKIGGVTAAATGLSLSADTIVSGTASGTPTTTTMVSDIGVAVDDQYKGRIIIFADDTTTANLRDQATDITGATASSNTLTFTALTTAPVSGDTFIIV